MSRTPSPSTDRDLALMLLLIVALLGLAGLAGLVMLGAAVTIAILGQGWHMPELGQWIPGALGVLAHPGQPGTGLGPPFSAALAGHAGEFWITTTVLLAGAVLIVLAVDVPLRRRFGPVTAGHASRRDIHQELSPHAARITAEWTRPGLSPAQRRHGPLGEIAVPLHTGPHHEQLCTPLENPTGTLAPTQSGKSRQDLVHKAIAAPGALLVSTTKADLLEFTGMLRTTRHNAGPVLVCDATGAVAWPARLHWPPLDNCDNPGIAYRRAHTMVEASSVGLRDIGGNDKVFRDRAKIVLQSYFLAAAHHHRDVADLTRWAMAKPPDHEPAALLQQCGYPDHARNLRAESGMVTETSDAVWMSVRRVLEPFLDTRIRDLCTRRPGEHQFNIGEFIAAGGSLYLIAGQHQATQTGPILTALVEQWLTTAQDMALHTPARRLDPPATAVLDELTTATPVPQIPDIAADSAGRGVLIHWGAQSIPALEDAYGTQRTRQLLDNTTTLTIWGGIKDARTLDWVSTLTGHHERRRYQHQSAGFTAGGRSTVGTETVPTYRAGDVRRIRRGRVLIIHRHLPPVLARTVDVHKRPDWPAIQNHIRHVRAGTAPVTPTGLPTASTIAASSAAAQRRQAP